MPVDVQNMTLVSMFPGPYQISSYNDKETNFFVAQIVEKKVGENLRIV
jgi:hypothetical protein